MKPMRVVAVGEAKEIMRLARIIRNSGVAAAQNAEFGHEKAVYKYQDEADAALKELADFLGEDMWR